MRETKTCPDQGWEQMPTEELDQILQAELRKDHPNEEVVLPILQVLEEREQDDQVDETPEYLASLKKLGEYATSSQKAKSRRGWITGVAALAAVVCIVIMAMPRTVGADSIFDVLFRWTESFFEFVDPDKDVVFPNDDSEFITEHPGLQELHNKITELGIEKSVVPMWVPKGYELLKLTVKQLSGNGNKVEAVFGKDDGTIFISYRMSKDVSTKIEKEETAIELFEFSDVSHFIVDNDKNLSVMWNVDGVECLINTNISKEDVYTLIKSIYRSNLK